MRIEPGVFGRIKFATKALKTYDTSHRRQLHWLNPVNCFMH